AGSCAAWPRPIWKAAENLCAPRAAGSKIITGNRHAPRAWGQVGRRTGMKHARTRGSSYTINKQAPSTIVSAMDNLDLVVLRALRDWRRKGRRALLATVVRTWGSAPRPI